MMAKAYFSCAPNNTADADFRLWGKSLSDAMTAVGFTKTADTGQIDWATVAKPASAGQIMGYEIREFSDALQATNPVIVKIEYGAASGSAAYPGGKITVGRASDGAGTLVGEVSGIFTIATGGSSATVSSSVVSGATDRIEFCLFIDSNTYATAFYIERIKDNAGANLGTGIDIGSMQGAASYQQYFPSRGLPSPLAITAATIPCCIPSGTVDKFSYAGFLGVFPIMTQMGYVANPNLAGFIFDTQAIGSTGSIITVSIFGVNHDFIITTARPGTVNGNTVATKGYAMRYE